MFGNLKKKILKRKCQRVKEGIIELEAQITFHQGMIDYEGETLGQAQIDQYKLAIKNDEAQIKTNKDYLRYVEPLI